jgi:hypothetical protein
MVKLKYFKGDPSAIVLAPMIGKEDNEKRNHILEQAAIL